MKRSILQRTFIENMCIFKCSNILLVFTISTII